MVETAANPKGKRSYSWLWATFVAIASLSTVATTGLYGYYEALAYWYVLPGGGHLDVEAAKHYSNISYWMHVSMSGSASLCCIESVCLLSGTVFWVRKMTLSEDTSGLKADALNLKMVFGHIALLLTQIFTVILNSGFYAKNFIVF
jgi:hypothetical protein